MLISFELPLAIEGRWKLQDGDGKTVASDETCKSAKLLIEPLFYKGMQSQLIMQGRVTGRKGRALPQNLRVAAATGKISAELADTQLTPIVPRFDSKIATEDNDE